MGAPGRPAPLPLPLGALGLRRAGTVVAFDEASGLGELEQEEGVEAGRRWPFHCVAVADGSRQVDLAAPVGFELALAPAGLVEARGIVPR